MKGPGVHVDCPSAVSMCCPIQSSMRCEHASDPPARLTLMGHDTEHSRIARLLECEVHRRGTIPGLSRIAVVETIVLCRLSKHELGLVSVPGPSQWSNWACRFQNSWLTDLLIYCFKLWKGSDAPCRSDLVSAGSSSGPSDELIRIATHRISCSPYYAC
jgi:hypothetical protein